ncbi:MAG: hypothetical protein CR984_05090 [Proteobacteria bacterium]|nr:MAG: hypothetical protein CR984_05090 [Pseudomonadota bacterium]PIE67279.1 MAG: hypothetical protein CSA23_04790 [Deltaproteobacteria bacterium]
MSEKVIYNKTEFFFDNGTRVLLRSLFRQISPLRRGPLPDAAGGFLNRFVCGANWRKAGQPSTRVQPFPGGHLHVDPIW